MSTAEHRRARAATRWVSAIALAAACVPVADASARVSLSTPKQATANSLITVRGSATAVRPGTKLRVQRVGGGVRVLARGRVSKTHRFALAFVAPRTPGTLKVRVTVAAARRSTVRKIRITAGRPTATRVIVSPKAQVIAPAAVTAVPAPGQAGTLRLQGGNDVQPGQVVAIDVGPHSPAGFLGRVTSVTTENGQTVAHTEPAALADAVLQGSLDAELDSDNGSVRESLTPQLRQLVSCGPGVTFNLTPHATFKHKIKIHHDWSWWRARVNRLSVEATASLDATVQAEITGKADCTIAPRTILTLSGPTFTVWVGPIPVVFATRANLYVEGKGKVEGALRSGFRFGFDAGLEFGYKRGTGLFGDAHFDPHLSFQPLALNASATLAASITPAVSVLIYGLGGPEFGINVGGQLGADVVKNPWWTVKAHIGLQTRLVVPIFNVLSSDWDTIYGRDFDVADSGGPAPAKIAGTPSQVAPAAVSTPTPPPPPPLLPDLTITELTATTVTVVNAGTANAGPFGIAVGGFAEVGAKGGLAMGQSLTLTYAQSCTPGPRTATADALGEVTESDERNNTRTFDPACSASLHPDLVITKVSLSTVTVKNVGTADAAAFSVTVDGFPAVPVAALAAGEQVEVQYRSGCFDGSYTAHADSLEEVDESDEQNNARTDSVACNT